MQARGSQREALSVGGIPFEPMGYSGTLDLFADWINVRKARQVCIVNVHTLISARRSDALAEIMRASGLNTPDGQPLRWYMNLVHRAGLQERVCGPELMLRCLDQGRGPGWKHYLLGGREEVLAELGEQLQSRFPGVRIVGAESPPFRPLSEAEDEQMLARINASGADFLWVGLGAPKQEFWIAEHLPRLQVPVNVGVGAAFDFHAGSIARAPEWMQRHGLEWLFRLVQDPRLWRRYLSTNPPFLWLLITDLVRHRLLGRTVPRVE